MQRLILLAILFATPSAWAAAQAERFDVASVRAGGTPGSFPSVTVMPGGRLAAPNTTLRERLRQAYGVDDDMIFGGPDWINRARFAVEAKAARADATPSQLQAMLAALLAERFSVKISREPLARPVFLLTLARSDGRLGPALRHAGVACEPISPPPGVPPPPPWLDSLPRFLAQEANANTSPRCPTMSLPGWMAGRAITMAQLTARLKPYAGRPVIDRTNLAGEFAFELRYRPELPPGARVPPTSDGESLLFTAVREQLGLALTAARAPVDVIVIVGAQHPTEN